MGKVYIQNLGMIITEKCNLDCKNCLRGEKCNHSMSDKVIKATLDQVGIIGNLCICGGEPTMDVDVLEKIFSYIIDNHIIVNCVTCVINGTIYSQDFLDAYIYINDYIKKIRSNDKIRPYFQVSYDDYHMEEIERLKITKQYFENLKKYKESEFYGGVAKINPKLKLFDEGNANFLDKDLTVKLRPIGIAVTYASRFRLFNKKGLCNIGPLITVNTDGIITECDASTIHQKYLYNYGNVFDNSIEEIALERGKVLKSKDFYREVNRIIVRNQTYNK